MSFSIEYPLSPRERSEAVRGLYEGFTTNELAHYLFRYSSEIPLIEDLDKRKRISDYLILLQSVAYAKGISDEDIKTMLNEQLRPFSIAKLRRRKVVNLADFQVARKLEGRRQHYVSRGVNLAPIPSNMRFLDAARARKR